MEPENAATQQQVQAKAAEPQGYDLSDVYEEVAKEDQGAYVHLKDLSGRLMHTSKGEPMYLRVAGTHSTQYRQCEAKQRRRKVKALTHQALWDDQMERVVACVLEWGGMYLHGEPYPLTPGNAHQMFVKAPHIFDQAVEAMGDHEGFSVGSSTRP